MFRSTARMNHHRRLGALGLAVATAAALAGCSAGPGSTTGSSSSTADIAAATKIIQAGLEAPSKIVQTEPLKSKPSPGSIIYLNNGEPGSVVIGHGTQAAAEAAGWTYTSIPYDASSPASLQQAFLNALAKKPTVVTEAGTPQSQFGASVLQQYKDAGVTIIPTSAAPVTAGGAIPVSDESIPNGYAVNKAMAETLAAWFVKDSKGKGKALIPDVTAFPTLEGVVDGFKEQTKKLCPDCTVDTIPISLSEVAAGTVVSTSVSAVQRTGANYLIFDNGQFGTGAEQALKTAGLTDVTVSGISPQPQQITAMRNGVNEAWMLQGFQYVGWATIDLALRLQQKMPLGSLDADQPVQLVTKENAKDVSVQVDIPIPSTGLDQFKKLWNVG